MNCRDSKLVRDMIVYISSMFQVVPALMLIIVLRGESWSKFGVVPPRWLMDPCLLANSVTEELTMRGYLIPRFEELFGSPVAAVVLSAILFASYHLYQGLSSSLVILGMGLVYGIFFCIVRRIWPLVIAHTITNLLIFYNV
jgi:membrane protease YdiL (CAAX protease family)